jgi:hypothetical protein
MFEGMNGRDRCAGGVLPLAALCVFALCRNALLPELPYEPPVVFEGYVELPGGGSTHLRLPGHARKPNTCTLVGDTLRMYFFSEDYDDPAKRPWYGEQLRVDLFPFTTSVETRYPHDTTQTNPVQPVTIVSLRNVLVRLSRFGKPANGTYLVSDVDTLYSPPLHAKMDIVHLDRRPGGAIDLRDFEATLHREGSRTPAVSITRGTITGGVPR